MPDRFANGNPENDKIEGYNENPARTEPFGRHGGDLAGIEKHLDYIKNLGMTTLWLNPILENNQPHQSYHGYAFTDLYKVDPRLGSLEDYKRLTAKCHAMGLKMVQDMVANHIGSKHWWMEDKPAKDWIHSEGDPFNRSNFRIETVADPHGGKYDQDKMLDGWFDIHMPDMNQKNPFLATYLIQNSIWWIAEVGIDGIRMDTYPYNNKEYMTRWCDEILREFPDFSLVGEVWVNQPSYEAYFTKGAKNHDGYKAGLPTVTDFPTYYAINNGLTEKGSWDNGLQKIYSTLCQDFLYKDPSEHLLFLDNHDLTRFYTYQREDFARFKQGIGMLLTLRGVPQWYYGTELLMTGDGSFHPDVRKDFPGGWPGDANNWFEEKNRTGKLDSAFRFSQALLNWRKTSPAIKSGKFVHYLPDSNVYSYFRTHKDQTIMVVVNGNDEQKQVNLKPFFAQTNAFNSAKDVLTGKIQNLKMEKWSLPARAIWIMELK
jgi:glycosidase